MELKEAKEKFIHTWGTLASQWGVNRTMAQIHALLLTSEKILNADQIMEELKISRGNVNMNLRELMSWGLINKKLVAGERKEFFVAEKDLWKAGKLIIKERKKRELVPIIETVNEIKTEYKGDNKEFKHLINQLDQVSSFSNKAIDTMVKSDESFLLTKFLKLLSS